MKYTKTEAFEIININKSLIGKNIFKTNLDVKITDVIVAPDKHTLFSEFIKDYTTTNDFIKSLNKINNDDNYRVLVVSYNQFDNMLYYQDLDKFKELVYQH